MKKLIPLTSALALSLFLASAAFAQDQGRGDDDDRGNRSERREDRREARQDRREDRQENRHENRQDRREDRGDDRVRSAVRDARAEVRDLRRDRVNERVDRAVEREIDRRIGDVRVVRTRRDWDRNVIVGCPPGLAKRDNGCLPPGQARKLANVSQDYARYDYLWSRRDDDYGYRYNDGYLYRTDRQGGLLGYLPVLGGVLSQGNVWPSQYTYDPLPAYQRTYYGLNDAADYRYADGAVYQLDPRTRAIRQVAALLTGQQFNVGQQMPSGYDVYNLPYEYRSQYADTAQNQYRYNDGYVYQVDPTTQLIQAAIQLVT